MLSNSNIVLTCPLYIFRDGEGQMRAEGGNEQGR